MILQFESLVNGIESLKLPAIVLIFLGAYIVKFRNVEKRISQKEDKSVVTKLTEDVKLLSLRSANAETRIDERSKAAEAKLERRVSNMGLVIVAVAPPDKEYEVIAGLKGE